MRHYYLTIRHEAHMHQFPLEVNKIQTSLFQIVHEIYTNLLLF